MQKPLWLLTITLFLTTFIAISVWAQEEVMGFEGEHPPVWHLKAESPLLIGGYGDNFNYAGDRVVPYKGKAEVMVNAAEDEGNITATFNGKINPEEGKTYEGEIKLVYDVMPADGPAFWEGGVADFIYLHGDTGQAPPVMPTLRAFLASWSSVDVYVNDELIYEDLDGHMMLTERVRDSETYKIYADATKTEPYSPNEPSEGYVIAPDERALHFVVHSDEPDENNFPPNTVWIHLNFQDVTDLSPYSVHMKVLIENISDTYDFTSSGVFNTPEDATEPGPLAPGGKYKFSFSAAPGSKLSFATMFVQSNDLFYAPDESGIALFDADNMPISGDVTSQIMLWDAGTEVNQEPGVGADQASRQAGPDTGADENGVVQPVNDDYTYPNTADVIRVMITATSETEFEVTIENISDDDTFLLAPGVWVVHTEDGQLFTAGEPDYGEGLEALAEDGNPSMLYEYLESKTGLAVVLAPGVWVTHTEDGPLFTAGEPDYSEGLEALAEDGNPSMLDKSVEGKSGVISSGVFNTPKGATEPGPLAPGGAYEFSTYAIPDSKLSFATMFVQSNDLFYAPDETGIALFDANNMPISGDVTSQIMLWDAGTEVNQKPGVGLDQAPRQAAPNTGADENGVVQIVDDDYTYPDTANVIRVTIDIMPKEKPVEKDYSNVFFMNLYAGLNMISLPLEPVEALTARDLAEMLDATVVIEFDVNKRRFVGFTMDSPDDGFKIEGGKGYIVNVKESKTVSFVGAAWTNQPPVESAPSVALRNSAWAFVLSGKLPDESYEGQYRVIVKNLRTGTVTSDLVNSSTNRFNAVWANLNRESVVETGDLLQVSVVNTASEQVIGSITKEITSEDITNAFMKLRVDVNQLLPTKNVLGQNYPNPFNPETWIPFKLAADSNVKIDIYSSTGQLVRTIKLGNQKAGIYLTKDRAAYWDGRDKFGEKVASGIYYYRLQADKFSSTKKMVILK